MEISQLTARAKDTERKLVEVPKEIDTAKSAALAKYQSSTEFGQVRSEGFEDGIRTFIYNIWRERPEWDLSFIGPMAKEVVVEFNAPPETPREEPPAEFMPLADQSPQAANNPP